jgi:hypothetical protein
VIAAFAAIAIAFGTAQAQEAPQQFSADLASLNASDDSGISPVTGTANIAVDDDQVTIEVQAAGLEPGSAHLMHIHLSDTCPDMTADTNDDGFVDIEEATAVHGGALVMLDSDPSSADDGSSVEADDAGNIDYMQTVAIDDLTAELPDGEDLDLASRTIEIHGVDDSIELPDSVATSGDASANETLPVACGALQAADAGETAGAAETSSTADTSPSATATDEDSEDALTATTRDDVPDASDSESATDNSDTADTAQSESDDDDNPTADTAQTESSDDDNATTDTAQTDSSDDDNATADTAQTESADDDNATADTAQTESANETSTPAATTTREASASNRSSGTPTPPIISANTGSGSNSTPSANSRTQRSSTQSTPHFVPPATGDAGLQGSQSSAGGSIALEAIGVIAILSLAGLGVYSLKRRQS